MSYSKQLNHHRHTNYQDSIKIYTNWVNTYLSKTGKAYKITSLCNDIKNGVVLADIISFTIGHKISGIHLKPYNEVLRRKNIELCINALKRYEIPVSKTVTINGLVHGKPPSIVSLLESLTEWIDRNNGRIATPCSIVSPSESKMPLVCPESRIRMSIKNKNSLSSMNSETTKDSCSSVEQKVTQFLDRLETQPLKFITSANMATLPRRRPSKLPIGKSKIPPPRTSSIVSSASSKLRPISTSYSTLSKHSRGPSQRKIDQIKTKDVKEPDYKCKLESYQKLLVKSNSLEDFKNITMNTKSVKIESPKRPEPLKPMSSPPKLVRVKPNSHLPTEVESEQKPVVRRNLEKDQNKQLHRLTSGLISQFPGKILSDSTSNISSSGYSKRKSIILDKVEKWDKQGSVSSDELSSDDVAELLIKNTEVEKSRRSPLLSTSSISSNNSASESNLAKFYQQDGFASLSLQKRSTAMFFKKKVRQVSNEQKICEENDKTHSENSPHDAIGTRLATQSCTNISIERPNELSLIGSRLAAPNISPVEENVVAKPKLLPRRCGNDTGSKENTPTTSFCTLPRKYNSTSNLEGPKLKIYQSTLSLQGPSEIKEVDESCLEVLKLKRELEKSQDIIQNLQKQLDENNNIVKTFEAINHPQEQSFTPKNKNSLCSSSDSSGSVPETRIRHVSSEDSPTKVKSKNWFRQSFRFAKKQKPVPKPTSQRISSTTSNVPSIDEIKSLHSSTSGDCQTPLSKSTTQTYQDSGISSISSSKPLSDRSIAINARLEAVESQRSLDAARAEINRLNMFIPESNFTSRTIKLKLGARVQNFELKSNLTWPGLDEEIKSMCSDHFKILDPEFSLGLSSEDVDCYKVGEIDRRFDQKPPELLPYGYLVGEFDYIEITMKSNGSFANAALETLIPVPYFQRFASQVIESQHVVIKGDEWSLKNLLANILGKFLEKENQKVVDVKYEVDDRVDTISDKTGKDNYLIMTTSKPTNFKTKTIILKPSSQPSIEHFSRQVNAEKLASNRSLHFVNSVVSYQRVLNQLLENSNIPCFGPLLFQSILKLKENDQRSEFCRIWNERIKPLLEKVSKADYQSFEKALSFPDYPEVNDLCKICIENLGEYVGKEKSYEEKICENIDPLTEMLSKLKSAVVWQNGYDSDTASEDSDLVFSPSENLENCLNKFTVEDVHF